jgi:hypothetical protein
LSLNLHKVGGRSFLDFIGFDGSSLLNGSTKKQQFLRKRGFARIGVRHNAKRPSPKYFVQSPHALFFAKVGVNEPFLLGRVMGN